MINIFEGLMPKRMAEAWIGSLHYALGSEQITSMFRRDTGNQWFPAKNGIDAMIDKATDAEKNFLIKFAKWHNENIWGEENGKPADFDGAEEGGDDANTAQ